MQASIRSAAECLRVGNHGGAEDQIRALQAAGTLNDVLSVIKSDAAVQESTYVHFVSLKLLRILLVRERLGWAGDKASVLQFIIDYAGLLRSKALLHEWRPVIVELAAVVAVVFKLGCITPELQVNQLEIANVIVCLTDRAFFCGPSPDAAGKFFHRLVCARTVEEFGLFDAPSRSRGLPISLHRQCRALFEDGGQLPVLVLSLLAEMLRSSSPATETAASLDQGLAAVVSCLSWPAHCFFEEQSATDESCASFDVSSTRWDEVFFHPLAAPAGPSPEAGQSGGTTLIDLLASWYVNHSLNAVPVDRQRIAEIAQLLCSFKGVQWSDAMCVRFLTSSFSLCMNIFESIAVSQDEANAHLLPVLANSLVRLVTNYTDWMLCPQMTPLVCKFSEMSKYLIVWDCRGDDDNVMSSLDEVLSAWYHLASYVDRDYSCQARTGVPDSSPAGTAAGEPADSRAALRRSCADILTAYLHCKTEASVVDDDEDGFADAFSNSHLELVSHIARISPAEGCASLSRTLTHIVDLLPRHGTRIAETAAGLLSEALWLVVTAIGHFVADKADGEQPNIPRCFQNDAVALSLVSLVEVLVGSSSVIFAAGSVITSPAVYAAYADALHGYCRCFIEPEDSATAVFASAMGSGADFVSFFLQFAAAALQAAPFEKDAMAALCSMLDSLADKSAGVLAFIKAQPAFHTIAQMATSTSHCTFVGHTRGRLLGFVASCLCVSGDRVASSAAAGEALAPLLAASMRHDSSVNELLECLTSIAGLFESVSRQEVIRAVFAPVMGVTEGLLTSAFDRFSERELAIEVVQCVLNMFSACVGLLENPSVMALLQLACITQTRACQSLQQTSCWLGADAESDHVAFLAWIARLVSRVSQWKVLDCFLPEADVAPISTATVSSLATLLQCLDQRTLCFPELEETLFAALEFCTEAFPLLVVFSPQADVFFSATYYALTSERASTQRAGVCVASQAADCFRASPPTQGDPGATPGGTPGAGALLVVVLRSAATGKVQQRNVRLVASTLTKLSSNMGTLDSIKTAMAGVAGELPPSGQRFLERLFGDLSVALQTRGASPQAAKAADQLFEAQLQDNLSLVRGTSLV